MKKQKGTISTRQSNAKEYTFQPVIHSKSSKLSAQYKKKKAGDPKANQYEWNQKKQEEVEGWKKEQKMQQELEESRDCTFKPKINDDFKPGRSNTPLDRGSQSFGQYLEGTGRTSDAQSKSFLNSTKGMDFNQTTALTDRTSGVEYSKKRASS